jgi:hypothetical protein
VLVFSVFFGFSSFFESCSPRPQDVASTNETDSGKDQKSDPNKAAISGQQCACKGSAAG